MKPELDDTLAAKPAPAPAPSSTSEPPGLTATAAGTGTVTAAAPTLVLGQQLGHFRIDRPLGAGGMGEVYLATDLALDRQVAIKVLPEALARDARRRDRLVREARAQARVTHANVAHIYFIGEEAGRLYFAMEYVAGKTLGERIAAGPLSVEEALGVIREAALGLREAQRNGFTHRDVKPSNLMIDEHGVIKVLDFGLAAGDPEATSEGPIAQTSLAGTPLYMAPEQGRGEAVDFRSDIYALGATLYHLVSGKPPFEANSADELLSLHATAARPLVRRRGVSRKQLGAIDAIVAKMMAAKPEDRYASYDELISALELASTVRTRPAGFWVRGIAAMVDMLVLTIATVMMLQTAIWVQGTSLTVNLEGGVSLFPMYVLYATVTTRRWGSTLGQLLFEIEVVDHRSGERPRWIQALGRAVAVMALPGLSMLVKPIATMVGVKHGLLDLLEGLLLVSQGGLLAWASLRSAGKRTPWDRLSGTMVRYKTGRVAT